MTRITRPATLALIAALVVVAVAASACNPQPKDALATVNGVAISASQVDSQLAQMEKASPQTFDTKTATGTAMIQQYRAQILNSLIQLEVIKQSGSKLGVNVTSSQVDAYIAQLKSQYGGQAGLDAAMKQSGITTAQLRDSITNRLLEDAVMAKVTSGTVNVTDSQIATYYASHKAQFAGQTQVHAAHILFATKNKALAQTVLAQIKGGADFATLAKKYSTDPGSKAKGGDLGWAPSAQYVAEFAQATEQMKVGEVRLVQSQYGWHIIKLLGRKDAKQQTLADVEVQIKQTLTQQGQSSAFQTWVTAQQKKAKVEILDATLKAAIDKQTAAQSPSTATTSGK
jgi:foldase protein PrsA